MMTRLDLLCVGEENSCIPEMLTTPPNQLLTPPPEKRQFLVLSCPANFTLPRSPVPDSRYLRNSQPPCLPYPVPHPQQSLTPLPAPAPGPAPHPQPHSHPSSPLSRSLSLSLSLIITNQSSRLHTLLRIRDFRNARFLLQYDTMLAGSRTRSISHPKNNREKDT
jgi:hypothetical protein